MPASRKAILAMAADAVGLASAALGGLLTAAPLTGGRMLGLTNTNARRRRVLGSVDLVLGVAIILSRSSRLQWHAVAARAVLHLFFAREYLRNSHRQNAVAMIALFAFDAGIALGLRKAAHSTEQVLDATLPKHETPNWGSTAPKANSTVSPRTPTSHV